MTAKSLFDKAIKLVGYGAIKGSPRITDRTLEIINEVYADLHFAVCDDRFVPIRSLSDEVHLPDRLLNTAAVYGICAALGEGENDDTIAILYGEKYNKARRTAFIGKVKDSMPSPSDC